MRAVPFWLKGEAKGNIPVNFISWEPPLKVPILKGASRFQWCETAKNLCIGPSRGFARRGASRRRARASKAGSPSPEIHVEAQKGVPQKGSPKRGPSSGRGFRLHVNRGVCCHYLVILTHDSIWCSSKSILIIWACLCFGDSDCTRMAEHGGTRAPIHDVGDDLLACSSYA